MLREYDGDIPISQYLLSKKHFPKRIVLGWCGGYGKDHKEFCNHECDLHYKINARRFLNLENDLSGVIPRAVDRKKLTDPEMIKRLIINLENVFSKCGKNFFDRAAPLGDVVKTRIVLAITKGQNQQVVPKLYGGNDMPKDVGLPYIDARICEIYKSYDSILMGEDAAYLALNVWEKSDVPGYTGFGAPFRTLSLRNLSQRKASIFNMVFGSSEGVSRSCTSTSGLYPYKLNKLVALFDKPTHVMSERLREIMESSGSTALDVMYTYMGVTSYFGKNGFRFNRELAERVIRVNPHASSGKCNGSRAEEVYGLVTYVLTSQGKKMEHFQKI